MNEIPVGNDIEGFNRGIEELTKFSKNMPNEQKWEGSHDYKQAVYAANKFLDEPYVDPDDDIRTISRQFLRQIERTDYFRTQIAQARRELLRDMINICGKWHGIGNAMVKDYAKICKISLSEEGK